MWQTVSVRVVDEAEEEAERLRMREQEKEELLEKKRAKERQVYVDYMCDV